ncbi:hypothetical protein VNO78_08405 [Psophocarpus tetragonolobus]|uniref:Uncharacterized protein n=1 Tax=Psophocarpus tetragonolobus TaxID=3891 RepID=A0AAN9SUS1_PSOTE
MEHEAAMSDLNFETSTSKQSESQNQEYSPTVTKKVNEDSDLVVTVVPKVLGKEGLPDLVATCSRNDCEQDCYVEKILRDTQRGMYAKIETRSSQLLKEELRGAKRTKVECGLDTDPRPNHSAQTVDGRSIPYQAASKHSCSCSGTVQEAFFDQPHLRDLFNQDSFL